MKILPGLTLCFLMLIGSIAQAAVTTTGDVTPGAWFPNDVPIIGNTMDGTLLIDGGSQMETSLACLGYGSGVNGTATVTGTGTSWTFNGRFIISSDIIKQFHVGYEGNGVLNINSGGTIDAQCNASLGYLAGSTGVATVDGAGSVWNCEQDLFVGVDGSGQLNIANGGQVNTTGVTVIRNMASEIHLDNGTLTTGGLLAPTTQLTGTGTITSHGMIRDNVNTVIDSPDDLTETILLNSEPGQNVTINLDMNTPGVLGAGRMGTSSLTITDGMEVTSTDAYFGYHAGSNGTGVVSGENTVWNVSNNLNVGFAGIGQLDVSGGGNLDSGRSWIGRKAGSNGTVTVSGTGSNWDFAYLTIGEEGSGTLDVTGGATVSRSDSVTSFSGCQLGREAGSSGIVNVSGAGSMWSCGYVLFVGFHGYGEVNITDGGIVNCNYDTYNGYTIATGSDSTGKVTVSGTDSAWNIGTNLFFGEGDGELHIEVLHGT